MPQFDPSVFFPQLVWLAITFIALYLLLSYYVLPRLGSVLQLRKQRVADDIAEAVRLRDEAKKYLKQYEDQIAKAHMEATIVSQQLRDESDADLIKQEMAFVEKMHQKMQRAEIQLKVSRDAVFTEIQETVATISRDIVMHLIGVEVKRQKIQKEVNTLLKQDMKGL